MAVRLSGMFSVRVFETNNHLAARHQVAINGNVRKESISHGRFIRHQSSRYSQAVVTKRIPHLLKSDPSSMVGIELSDQCYGTATSSSERWLSHLVEQGKLGLRRTQ